MDKFHASPSEDVTESDDDELGADEVTPLSDFVDLTFDFEDDSEVVIIDSAEDADAIIVDSDDAILFGLKQPKAIRRNPDDIPQRRSIRNGPISHPFEALDHWPEGELKPGKTVELKPEREMDGDFLCIQNIIFNPTKDSDNVFLRGLLLRRDKYVGGMVGTARVGEQTVGGKLKKSLNELSFIFQVDHDDPRKDREQSMVTRALADVLCVRNVLFTHEHFPKRSYRETTVLNHRSPNYDLQKQIVKETGVLVCRHAYTDYFEDAAARLSKKKCIEGSLRRLYNSESDFASPKPQTSSSANSWSKDNGRNSLKRICTNGPVTQRRGKITYGSGCCGAGGDALGAKWAGAKVKYGWDHNKAACTSFELNHPRAKVYLREAENFPSAADSRYCDECDILHLSWPCDYFSPNHTHEGRNDDANISAMFGTYEKLMSAKPQIHTQENTFGIFSHHPEFFGALIQEIMRAGYNVRWKIDQFADHGSPVSRKRLVIIAAQIGVPLPEFPKATHGPPGSGLSPYKTVHDAIAKIPACASWHLDQIVPYRAPLPAYNPHIAKSACITRDGGKAPHPEGWRPFTPREMSNLQGFPENYQYIGTKTEVKTQIGNAIPPNVWRHYIKSCVNTLEAFHAGLIDETGQRIEPRISGETRPSNTSAVSSDNNFSNASYSSTPGTDSSNSSTFPSLFDNFSRTNGNSSRFWSGSSHTLSPEPQTATATRFKNSPEKLCLLKREHAMIDLTEDDKGVIDLTGDD